MQILRKNFSATAKKRIQDFPPSTFEVELNDGTIAYWPTSKANELDVVLHQNFKEKKKRAINAASDADRSSRSSSSANAARTDARFTARHADPVAKVDALVELDEQIAFDKP